MTGELADVHFFGHDWQVGSGWLNLAQVVAVRPTSIDLSPLCATCADEAVRTGIVPPVLAVRTTVDDVAYRLLGDGRQDDEEAVRQAHRLLRMRRRCEREQHSPSGPLRGAESLPDPCRHARRPLRST